MTFSPPLVIRIVPEDGAAVDWTVPTGIQFRDVLEAVSQVMPSVTVTSFDYEDEEKDRITVRSDEELQTMINGFFWLNSEKIKQGVALEPIAIFPRAGRSSRKRNICGLTVNTRVAAAPSANSTCMPAPMSTNSTIQPPVADASGVPTTKKEGGNISSILASGQVNPDQIQHLEILGYGNGGTVYRAIDLSSNKVLAVKVIPLDVTKEVQKQIISEMEILFQCSSPYIIEFYGAFFIENRISMCTEYMDGGSLENYGKIPEPVLGRIAVSVVKGLAYLWDQKIMHRDVKPSNFLVNTQGQVKLCDFGVSRQLVNSVATTYVGTNAYMAPERVLGDEYSIRSEVWSLGVSLFEMAIGRFPYLKDYPERVDNLLPIELLQCIVHEVPPRLPSRQFSAMFVDFVAQCMQKSPNYRLTPKAVVEHAFIRANDDNNRDIISMWVCRKLEVKRSRAPSIDSPASV
ncbi:dual specificity mitogen-activated protein kinase kinase 5-like [Actinia tenebrosa]|uniref:mitogen-activated protein kinase kinase n=1 Tax=Actinia tenebrosa TaxID=6105 RepID=A0A6P8I5B8_ACTTE|nr:dual specificity mitogen-activated protein kinase kinase 5-like [Actinia tenebrosa]